MNQQPYFIAFTCAEGVKLGRVIRWITKLWWVKTRSGDHYVLPCQVLWLE